MIISHRHRYLFVELPHTGSTAVSHELREHYGGEKVHGKHSPYHRFARSATQDEKQYFTFAAVRNPIDVAVTKYVLYATNHKGWFTDPLKVARNRGLGNWLDRRIQQRVVEDDLDFSEFFLMVYRFPFNTWACLDHKNFDYVMRFENLQDDFADVLAKIGLEQVRPLPVVNQSARERSESPSYYSPEAIQRAKKIFAGYMDEWGYEFPEAWGTATYSSLNRFKYRSATWLLKLYWRYLKDYLWVKKWHASVPAGSARS